jgi:peroxiredoxin
VSMTTKLPTISEQVEAMSAEAVDEATAAKFAPFVKDQARLSAEGVPTAVAAAGTPMPDGGVLDVHGSPTTLAALRGEHPAVIVFYRGAWCPYCNIALRTYQNDLVPDLADRGIALIAISPQKPDGSLSAQETNELTYTVASDPANRIADKLGIVINQPAEVVAAQANLGLDLAVANAEGATGLPMPTVLVVDAEGVIRWIDVHPNYTERSEVADILAAVAAIG